MDNNADIIPENLISRISSLEEDAGRLDYRMKYSERLHRKVGEDGDIHHYDLMIPYVMVSAIVGSCVAFIFMKNKIW